MFSQLKEGQIFELEGKDWEVWIKGDRVVLVYELDDILERIPDEADQTGYRTSMISDMRYNKQRHE